MNKIKFFVFFVILAFNCSCALKNNDIQQLSEPERLSDGDIVAVEIENTQFNLVVSQSSIAKIKGLSGRDEIPQDGMIFLFNEPHFLTFWMKDMLFPIDIIWINDNEVIGICENVQNEPPETPDIELKKYHSNDIADKVIELNAGKARKSNIKKGSIIKIKNGEENGK